MFYLRIIFGLLLHVIFTVADETETIIDLYHKINNYGSLSKATSLDIETQAKLKNANTIRMDFYQIPSNRTSIHIRLHRHMNEQIALIELRCNASNVFVRLGKTDHHRICRLSRISDPTSTSHSYDLTNILSDHEQRTILLMLEYPIEQSGLSIFYYSKSNTNLFSYSSPKHLPRRYRRTIQSNDSNSACSRHEYEIDFDQFSFGRWILEPKRFNAYACSGSCPSPLLPKYYPSNHAVLISLMNTQVDRGQQPLCVPVRLRPLSLLYYDRDELVIKYHRDMIVHECGCR